MDLGINGKVAIVTGGSKGLGRYAAIALAREGVNVAICARNEESLNVTVKEIQDIGVSAIGITADIADESSARNISDMTADALGPVDILVNNVGGRHGETIMGTTEDQFQATFQVNLFGALRLMWLTIPSMQERKWGRVINIASIWGREYGGTPAYMVAKAALIAATKYAALELVKDNVLVNSVAPGSIIHPGGSWDRFSKQQPPEVVKEFIERNLPSGKFGWPEPLGDIVAFLASERASLIAGACINVDGGQSRSLL